MRTHNEKIIMTVEEAEKGYESFVSFSKWFCVSDGDE